MKDLLENWFPTASSICTDARPWHICFHDSQARQVWYPFSADAYQPVYVFLIDMAFLDLLTYICHIEPHRKGLCSHSSKRWNSFSQSRASSWMRKTMSAVEQNILQQSLHFYLCFWLLGPSFQKSTELQNRQHLASKKSNRSIFSTKRTFHGAGDSKERTIATQPIFNGSRITIVLHKNYGTYWDISGTSIFFVLYHQLLSISVLAFVKKI